MRGAFRQYLEKLFYTDEGYSQTSTMDTSTDFVPPRQKRIQGEGNFLFLYPAGNLWNRLRRYVKIFRSLGCFRLLLKVLSHEDTMSAIKVFFFILLSRFYIDVA